VNSGASGHTTVDVVETTQCELAQVGGPPQRPKSALSRPASELPITGKRLSGSQRRDLDRVPPTARVITPRAASRARTEDIAEDNVGRLPRLALWVDQSELGGDVTRDGGGSRRNIVPS